MTGGLHLMRYANGDFLYVFVVFFVISKPFVIDTQRQSFLFFKLHNHLFSECEGEDKTFTEISCLWDEAELMPALILQVLECWSALF